MGVVSWVSGIFGLSTGTTGKSFSTATFFLLCNPGLCLAPDAYYTTSQVLSLCLPFTTLVELLGYRFKTSVDGCSPLVWTLRSLDATTVDKRLLIGVTVVSFRQDA